MLAKYLKNYFIAATKKNAQNAIKFPLFQDVKKKLKRERKKSMSKGQSFLEMVWIKRAKWDFFV